MFLLLRFIPKLIHLRQRHILEGFPHLDAMGLDVVEAIDKLTIGFLQGIIRIQLIETRRIDNRKEGGSLPVQPLSVPYRPC